MYKHKRVGEKKIDPRWWGPARIATQVGAASYVIEWGADNRMVVHADDLRPYEAEEFAEEGEDLWYFRGTEGGPKDGKGPGPVVEKIVAHRVRPDATLEFLVKWSGWDDHYNTWEPVWALTKACEPWVEYCHENDIGFEAWELSKCLLPQEGENAHEAREVAGDQPGEMREEAE